jgi:drug/metabolite transporter (DMT)-like permease
MRLLTLIFWLLSIGVVVWVQVWHARRGYPRSVRAKLGLFLSGFLCGASGAWFVFSGLSVAILGGMMAILGILMGIYSAYIFPGKMETWIPRRSTASSTDSERS